MNIDNNKENTTPQNEVQENNEDTATEVSTNEESAPNKKGNKKSGKKGFFKSRKAKHGSVAILIVVLGLVATIVLNIVSSLLVDRFPALSVDMTANQVFALQEDTTDYISHLDQDVEINVLATKENFVSNGSYFVQAQQLLENMQSISPHIKVNYIDITKNPTFTSKYENVDWTQQNLVFLVQSGDDYRVLSLDDCFEYDQETFYYYGSYDFSGSNVEQALVTSILNVTTEDKAIVDFITGYSEVDYSNLTKLLESNAYQVNDVSLATSELDEDAKLAVLFAPAVDLDPENIEKIEKWLENDGEYGKSLLYVANYELKDTPNLNVFLEKWGMKMSDGVIFESNQNYLVANTPFVSLTDYNDVFVEGLKNAAIPCVSSYTKGIEITDTEMATPVLKTSTSAGLMPYDEAENESWDYQSAITGEPLNVAVKGTQQNTEEVASNVVAFGSYQMFSDTVMSYNSYNNSAFFMNMVNTLADRDNVGITIEGKAMDISTLGIDLLGQNILMVIFVIIVPIATLIVGLVIWLRRRNK